MNISQVSVEFDDRCIVHRYALNWVKNENHFYEYKELTFEHMIFCMQLLVSGYCHSMQMRDHSDIVLNTFIFVEIDKVVVWCCDSMVYK